MAEEKPSFTVSDRRKFTLEGELRDDAPQSPENTQTLTPDTPFMPAAAPAEPAPGPRLVTPAATQASETAVDEEEPLPEPTAEETAEQHTAYKASSEHLDSMLRQANPGMGPSAEVTMEHVIQSIYISAIMAMGAATEPGQKPRIDIVGARQSVDMLGVLQEKTKGNLTEKEQRLLQNALFELRMMFLEITNAIAQQAQNPAKGKK